MATKGYFFSEVKRLNIDTKEKMLKTFIFTKMTESDTPEHYQVTQSNDHLL